MTIKKDLKVTNLIIGLSYVTLENEKDFNEAIKPVERTHMERIVKIIKAKPLSEKTNEPR